MLCRARENTSAAKLLHGAGAFAAHRNARLGGEPKTQYRLPAAKKEIKMRVCETAAARS